MIPLAKATNVSCVVPTLGITTDGEGQRKEKKTEAVGQLVPLGSNALLRFHLRPIDVVVSHGPSSLRTGTFILEPASHLDAFSAYPIRTWLPGDAPGGTTRTPEVRSPRSSRTRGNTSQISYAHGG